ncbi:MAG: hypothetical protein ACTSRG_18790 [Candidatus Helarchaeota archaeon]
MKNISKFRAYILLRLSNVGSEWEVCERIKKVFPRERVTYACPVYGENIDLHFLCSQSMGLSYRSNF